MSRTDVPTKEQCHWDLPPVPRPLFVCWHPESDDCWNMMGSGQTPDEAYSDLIDQHAAWVEEMRERMEIESQPWEVA